MYSHNDYEFLSGVYAGLYLINKGDLTRSDMIFQFYSLKEDIQYNDQSWIPDWRTIKKNKVIFILDIEEDKILKFILPHMVHKGWGIEDYEYECEEKIMTSYDKEDKRCRWDDLLDCFPF